MIHRPSFFRFKIMSSCQRFCFMIIPIPLVLLLILLIVSYFKLDPWIAQSLSSLDLRSNYQLLQKVFHLLGESPLYIVLFFSLTLYYRYIAKNIILEEKCWFLTLSVFIPVII